MIDTQYGCIITDVPWKFSTYSHKGKGRSAEAHYDCMSIADIKALPVYDYGAPDSVLLFWVTDPFLEKGLEIIKSWGYTYKTVGFTWAKLNKHRMNKTGTIFPDSDFFMGTGYWSRANTELCLLATKGHPKRLNRDVRKLIVSERRLHSQKPDEVYERAERLCSGPYLDMFSRTNRPNWDSWGNETGLLNSHVPVRKWKSDSYPKNILTPNGDTDTVEV